MCCSISHFPPITCRERGGQEACRYLSLELASFRLSFASGLAITCREAHLRGTPERHHPQGGTLEAYPVQYFLGLVMVVGWTWWTWWVDLVGGWPLTWYIKFTLSFFFFRDDGDDKERRLVTSSRFQGHSRDRGDLTSSHVRILPYFLDTDISDTHVEIDISQDRLFREIDTVDVSKQYFKISLRPSFTCSRSRSLLRLSVRVAVAVAVKQTVLQLILQLQPAPQRRSRATRSELETNRKLSRRFASAFPRKFNKRRGSRSSCSAENLSSRRSDSSSCSHST